jgi:tetratricopeptide (TPR) repeat protein
MTSAHLLPLAALAALAGIFVAWPLFGRRAAAIRAAAAPDHHRQELLEERGAIYRALQELAFDHEAGHLSDDDHRELRQRYESRAAEVLRDLDALGPATPGPGPTVVDEEPLASGLAAPAVTGWTRSPVAIGVGAMVMVVFGVILGIGVGRFSQPEAPSMPAGAAMPAMPGGPGGGMPGAPGAAAPGAQGAGAPGGAMAGMGAPGQPLPPQVLSGMLQAARQMLFQGQYQEAISAYQAVLKREPNNVDAMTHLALIVAIGGHADSALETWDKALKLDPKYAPAYLYRGQVLYETKQDYAGAIKAWERFVALVPSGQDHDRAQALIKDARTKQSSR